VKLPTDMTAEIVVQHNMYYVGMVDVTHTTDGSIFRSVLNVVENLKFKLEV